jgi:actin-like ATPase involved in cell morphogenesis
VDRKCLAPGDLVRDLGGGRSEVMLVVMVGIASGEVARRGVAGR